MLKKIYFYYNKKIILSVDKLDVFGYTKDDGKRAAKKDPRVWGLSLFYLFIVVNLPFIAATFWTSD